jgi:YfiH family protein
LAGRKQLKDSLKNSTQVSYETSDCKINFYGVELPTTHKYVATQDQDWPKVIDNRKIINELFGPSVFLRQIHSNICHQLKTPLEDYISFDIAADGIITEMKNINLIIQTADCVPILFKSSDKKIIGACHAGWKGAISGVIENTIEALNNNGAEEIEAFIGPCISQENYEVDEDFYQIFLKEDKLNQNFFAPQGNKYLFNLQLYTISKLEKLNIKTINICNIDTYSNKEYFSYRRFCHSNKQAPYGSNLSIISLC